MQTAAARRRKALRPRPRRRVRRGRRGSAARSAARRRRRAAGASARGSSVGAGVPGRELDDPEANDAVGDPQRALQVGQQRGRPVELQQVVLGVGAVADLVGQGTRAPVVIAHDRAGGRDRGLDVGEDLLALVLGCARVEQQDEVVKGFRCSHEKFADRWTAAAEDSRGRSPGAARLAARDGPRRRVAQDPLGQRGPARRARRARAPGRRVAAPGRSRAAPAAATAVPVAPRRPRRRGHPAAGRHAERPPARARRREAAPRDERHARAAHRDARPAAPTPAPAAVPGAAARRSPPPRRRGRAQPAQPGPEAATPDRPRGRRVRPPVTRPTTARPPSAPPWRGCRRAARRSSRPGRAR